MTPDMSRLLEFAGALSVITGAMAWWRKDTDQEDAAVADAHDVILDTLSDADLRKRLGCIADVDLGHEITVEEAEAMNSERELRRYGWERN